jgi:hypothetical protein
MEKVTGPNRAVPPPVQHWPYHLPASGCRIVHWPKDWTRPRRRGPSGCCAGISPSRLWSVGVKDTATGAITVTVNYQRP